MTRDEKEIKRKLRILKHTEYSGNITKTYRYFGIARYHAIKLSESTVTRILKRYGLRRLPQRSGRCAVHTRRYNKQVAGHPIQIGVKFLTFKGNNGSKIKGYQCTAIDDATRIRALQIYDRHTQKNAIHFVHHVIEKCPFRIQQICTDR